MIPKKENMYSQETYIDFAEIKEGLCGFARIFEFHHSIGEMPNKKGLPPMAGPVIASSLNDTS